jgi:hypothetical protein
MSILEAAVAVLLALVIHVVTLLLFQKLKKLPNWQNKNGRHLDSNFRFPEPPAPRPAQTAMQAPVATARSPANKARLAVWAVAVVLMVAVRVWQLVDAAAKELAEEVTFNFPRPRLPPMLVPVLVTTLVSRISSVVGARDMVEPDPGTSKATGVSPTTTISSNSSLARIPRHRIWEIST